jgi:hypothetical protein
MLGNSQAQRRDQQQPRMERDDHNDRQQEENHALQQEDNHVRQQAPKNNFRERDAYVNNHREQRESDQRVSDHRVTD